MSAPLALPRRDARGLRHQPAAEHEPAQLQKRNRNGLRLIRRGLQRLPQRLRGFAQAAPRLPAPLSSSPSRADCSPAAHSTPRDLRKQRAQRRAAIAPDLAADEIVRLNAGGAFVNRRDPHVARVLRGARLFDEAHAAMNLNADVRDLVPVLRAPALHDRDQQIRARLRFRTRAFIRVVLRDVELNAAYSASARIASTLDLIVSSIRFTSG